jgi:hypothetical protein
MSDSTSEKQEDYTPFNQEEVKSPEEEQYTPFNQENPKSNDEPNIAEDSNSDSSTKLFGNVHMLKKGG